jgi:hypothetical protein
MYMICSIALAILSFSKTKNNHDICKRKEQDSTFLWEWVWRELESRVHPTHPPEGRKKGDRHVPDTTLQHSVLHQTSTYVSEIRPKHALWDDAVVYTYMPSAMQ